MTKRMAALAALLLAVVGCRGGGGATAADPAAADPGHAPTDTAPAAVAAGQGSGPPKVLEGLCPFECCTYREWTALQEVVAYRSERDTTAAAFTLAAGERFTAHDGNVHVDRPGLAVVTDTSELRRAMGRTFGLAPGDTLALLAPAGEGHMWMWNGRETFTADPLYGGRIVRDARWDWWVRVSNAAGASGWIRMGDQRGRIGGADGCA